MSSTADVLMPDVGSLVDKGFPDRRLVSRAVAGMRAVCDELTDVAMWSMTGDEAASTLTELVRLEAQIAELKTRTLARADQTDVAPDRGATSTPSWLARTTRTTRREAHRAMRLAGALEDHDPTRLALAQGRLHVEQAEAHLIDLAHDFDATSLRHLARHVLEVACPAAADAHEAKLLEREGGRPRPPPG